MDYQKFLVEKLIADVPTGFDPENISLNPMLFDFQRDLVLWALRRGRAALFCDCGLGKTPMQLEWAKHVCAHTGGNVLILAPLAVSRQTKKEGDKFGVDVNICRTQADVRPGVNITNYEMMHNFVPGEFVGIVLDESGILKAYTGKYRTLIIEMWGRLPYRLACTATPAPNDFMELGNHAEFLGIMGRSEMLSMFFINDAGDTGTWRIKGHAESEFWRWVCSWAVMIRKPSDLGYEDGKFTLPELHVQDCVVKCEKPLSGFLFHQAAKTLSDRRQARRESMPDRVTVACDLILTAEKFSVKLPKINNGGLHYGVEKGVRGEQGEEGTGEPGTAADSSFKKVKDSRRKQNISERLLPEEQGQGQVQENERTTGQDQFSEEDAVRRRQGFQGKGQKTNERVASKKPREKEGPEAEKVFIEPGGISDTSEKPESPMRYMRTFGHDDKEYLPTCRPLPYDGESAGSALCELQPCSGEVQGRCTDTQECNHVSRKQWLIWCDLNAEQDALTKQLRDNNISVSSIQGATPTDDKIRFEEEWRLGKTQVLITKPSVMGWGINWQHCNNMAFVGLSDSFEAYYQAVRRCWRFGQKQEVFAHIITSELEGNVSANIKRKEADALKMAEEMVRNMSDISSVNVRGVVQEKSEYQTNRATGEGWELINGDSVEFVADMPDESIHYSIFSPPFASLFTYSNSNRDMGNCKNVDDFEKHFQFLVRELFRVTKQGRLLSFHCMQLPSTITHDGVIGMKDFRGLLIRMFEAAGFIYHSEVCIWKDPLIQATRTKTLTLAHKQISKDSSMCAMGYPDYIVTMRKPGKNQEPIAHGRGFESYAGEMDEPKEPKTNDPRGNKYSHKVWQRYASPVWFDIRQTHTLNSIKAEKDEKHCCPIQLDSVERCLELWSNPGDLILSPFAGIGSEGYQSIKMGRRFIGVELKPEYFNQAVTNLKRAEKTKDQMTLFDIASK